MPTATASETRAEKEPTPSRWPRIRLWVALVARVGLAGVWFWAGIAKIGDPAESVRAVRAYRLLPEFLAKAVGYGLPFLEIAVAVLLLIGLATRVAAAVSAALLVVFLIGIVSAAARGLQIECGCFGGGGDVGAGQSTAYTSEIVRDGVLLLVSVFLVVWARSALSVDDAVRRGGYGSVPDVRVGRRRTKEAQQRLAELAARREAEAGKRVRIASALSAVVLVAVAGIGIGVQSSRVGGPPGANPAGVAVEDGVTVGKANAKVTVTVYEDFQCPVCQTFEAQSGSLLQSYISAGTVKVNYKMVSFLDRFSSGTKYSTRSANAGYCAADDGQEVFSKFHQLLFANQPEENASGLTDDQLISYGTQAGVGDAFAACVRNQTYTNFVDRITEDASRNEVNGTPTVRVGNTELGNPTNEALTNAIKEALK